MKRKDIFRKIAGGVFKPTDYVLAKPKRRQPERQLQSAVCRWLDRALPSATWYSAIPGGNRSVTTTPGYRSGTPDIMLVHHGRTIFLELKAPRKSATKHQRDVHAELTTAGALVATVRSLDDCYNFLSLIMKLRAKPQ